MRTGLAAGENHLSLPDTKLILTYTGLLLDTRCINVVRIANGDANAVAPSLHGVSLLSSPSLQNCYFKLRGGCSQFA